ncbi:helix-turn-helix domain-containing protein [Sungkyunkwania multivorans]|uniref:Helix-turn-helix domain-containing protein n=1 Tax=Sungkyunkwania multivorans TaxID=1173618 RepID=A0ABW3D3I9_9FLAO
MTRLPPQNKISSKYIDAYYFLKSDEEKFDESFTHYPHYRTTLNIYNRSKVEIFENKRIISFDSENDVVTVFTNNISTAKQAVLRGPFDIIGILFKPLGINQFTRDDFLSKFDHPVVVFNNFWSGHVNDLSNVFNENSNDKKVLLLDELLLKLYNPLNEERLSKIVQKILDSKGAIKVKELEVLFTVNRRTLLRLFKTYLGCSISEFKRVTRFRNTIDSYQNSPTRTSFTELCYDNNYYDQSDFINHFKSLSGEIPKEVLPKITKVDQTDLYWKFRV